MTTNIIDRLNETLESATAQRMADLDHFEANILGAIAKAEQAAQERIDARLTDIDHAIACRMLAFRDSLADMASVAITQAVNHLAGKLDPVTTPEATPEPVAATTPEPTPEAAPIPSFEQVQHDLEEYREQAEEEYLEQTATATVAAHAIESGYAVVAIDEDTDDQIDADEDAALMATAGDHEPHVETTSFADDLHERRGQGRGSRYVRAEFPQIGETYFRKIEGRWTPVRLVG